MANPDLSADIARQLFNYDPATGLLTWSVRRRRASPGSRAGSVNHDGYIRVKVLQSQHFAHRIAWLLQTGEWPKGEVDHRNGVRDDNRWSNLRDVDRSVNMQNQRRAQRNNVSSGLLGVRAHQTGKWQARIRHGSKQLYLGTFDTPEQAHAAYLIAKSRLHVSAER